MVAHDLFEKGHEFLDRGEFGQALRAFGLGLELYRALNHRMGEASCLHGAGFALTRLQRRDEARDRMLEALNIYQEIAATPFEAMAAADVGAVFREMGAREEALARYEYALELFERLGNEREVQRTRGIVAELRAIRLLAQSVGDSDDRITELEGAVAGLREAGNTEVLAASLQSLGLECLSHRRAEEARQHLEESLALSRQLDSESLRRGEATTLWGLGTAYRDLGRRGEALEHLRKAIEVGRSQDDSRFASMLHQSVGVVSGEVAKELFEGGALTAAMPHTDEALEHFREARDPEGEAGALQMRGALQQRAGRLDDALTDLTAAREMLARLSDQTRTEATSDAIRQAEGITVNAIGAVYKDLGRLEEALQYCQEALAIRREIEDRTGEATTLNDLSVIEIRLGNLDEARRNLEAALAAARDAGNPGTEAVVLQNLGSLYADIGRPKDAMEALLLASEIHREWKNRRHEGWLLMEMGDLTGKAGLGSTDEMMRLYREALAAFQEVNDRPGEGRALSRIGTLMAAEGLFRDALEHTEQALAIVRKVGDPLNETSALANLGTIHRRLDHPREALRCFEEAIEIVERMRGQIASEEHRASYFATVGELYADYASILVEQGEAERAFEAAERGRARVFIELLAEAQAQVREGVDPELREQELGTLSELGALRGRLIEARSQSAAEPDPQLLSGLEHEEQELESRLHTLEAEIRLRNPRYAALTQPTAWGLREIQEQLLDEGTALLEYVLSDRGSLLFCVLKDDFEVFTLPPREEIETKVRELRAAVLHGLHRYPHGDELYRDLIAPAADLIEGKDLLICADGILHYLPFSLLLTGAPEEGDGEGGAPPGGRLRAAPGGGEEEDDLLDEVRASVADLPAFDFKGLPYLIRRHAISYAPSATVAGMVRAEARGRRRYDAELAAFADPRGLGAEEQEEDEEAGGEELPVELEAALAHTRDTLEPIPATAEEVWALAELLSGGGVPQEHPERFDHERVALRTAAAATKAEVERLTSGERSFRFLHIATHGLLDPEKPQFSGLVFTPQDGEDPFWRTFEIFNARIPSELVVLSACETGLGRIVSGEGIVGLTRAFLYAGAPSVCVSLWKVAEESSPQLMRSFYRRILAGQSKAKALQGAQLELLEETPYAHPFWWGPFVLVGEG